jgi:hypothetical protein
MIMMMMKTLKKYKQLTMDISEWLERMKAEREGGQEGKRAILH